MGAWKGHRGLKVSKRDVGLVVLGLRAANKLSAKCQDIRFALLLQFPVQKSPTLSLLLVQAFDQSWQNGNRSSHYRDPDRFFLGPFVFVDEPRSRRFLVDGQQRFTTIHLIFMHLRRAAEALRQKESEDKLRRVIGEFEGRRIKFRLDIEERRALLEALYSGKDFEPRIGAPISVRNMAARSGWKNCATTPACDCAARTAPSRRGPSPTATSQSRRSSRAR